MDKADSDQTPEVSVPRHDPVDRVMGSVDGSRVEEIVAALKADGLVVTDVLSGEAGLTAMRAKSDGSGIGGFFDRLTLSLGGNLDHLHASEAEVAAGRAVVFVEAGDDQSKRRAGDAFARHDARLVTYFGKWTIEPLG